MNPTRRNPSIRGRALNSNKNRFSKSRPRKGGKFSNSRPSRGGAFKKSNFSRGGRPNYGGGRGGKKMNNFNPSQFINANPVKVVEEIYVPKNSFDTFGLDPILLRNVKSMGIETPSPIQDQVIPEVMKGHNVIGLAETGTGKTVAFLLPLIEKNIKNINRQTLILAPTRELAIQIAEELKKLSAGLRIFGTTCVGGMNINPQIRALRRRNQFIIGTPGRVNDLINKKQLETRGITAVVLDEADRMLDMGFINDVRKILSSLPTNKETLFFSATMPPDAKKLVNDFIHNAVEISVKKKDTTDSIEQDVIRYNKENKFDVLLKILGDPNSKRVLVFGSMKHSVEKLSKRLSESSIRAESIHGNKNHTQRQRALNRFKKGEVQVLTATDVAARGIHVDDITHVINYDLPNSFEDYVHRIGRTGRGTKRGKALTFVLS